MCLNNMPFKTHKKTTQITGNSGPYYYKLWRHVIEESGMLAKQEWIRFYEGDFMDHGHLDVYMRKGQRALLPLQETQMSDPNKPL
eukprot:1403569-Amphidinium_carterae.1